MIYPGEGKKGQPKAGDYVLAAERVRAEAAASPHQSTAFDLARADKWEGQARTKQLPSWARNTGKYRGKPHGRPVGTNHCKFLSSHPRVPDDGRDRAVGGGRQEVEPLRPSGRDYDPDRLSPRLAGVRIVRSAMVAG